MPGEVQGLIGDQEVRFSNAATETTLELLLQAVLAQNSGKSAAAKIQKAYEESLKKSTDATKKSVVEQIKENTARRDANKLIDEEIAKRKAAVEDLIGFANTIGNVVGKGLTYAFGQAAPKITDFTDALSGVPIVGAVIGALGNVLQSNIDNFRELSRVGADFGDQIEAMRYQATEAGLALDDYKNIIVNNSQSLAMLGGSVSRGVKIFNDVSASIRNRFNPQLARLGFSMAEAAEYTIGFMTMQQQLGQLERKNTDKLAESTFEYMLELDKLARLHGIERKEVEQRMLTAQEDKRVKSLLLGMAPAAQKELRAVLAGIKDAEVGEAIKELVATEGIPLSDFALGLAGMSPAIANASAALRNQQITADQYNAVLRSEALRLAPYFRAQGKEVARFQALGETYFDAAGKLVGQFDKHGQDLENITEEQRKAMDSANKSIANVDRQLLLLRNAIMIALEPALKVFENGIVKLGNTVDPNSPLIKSLQNFFTTIAKGTNKFITTFNEEGLGKAISNALKGTGEYLGPILADILAEAFKALFTNPTVVNGLVLAIGALFASKLAVAAMMRNMAGANVGPQLPGAGRYGNLIQGVKGFGIGAVASFGAGMAADALGKDTKAGASMDVLGSAAGMAGTGALIGSFLGPLGTAAGAVLGGTLGAGMGLYQNRNALFSSNKSKTPEVKDTAIAAQVVQTTTAKEVKEMAAALKELDYNKLMISPDIITNVETGTLKIRGLKTEINAVTTAFKDLNNTGLDKITKGLGRLDESFKSFNRSFVEDFMSKFKELDKKSQESLLTDLNGKLDQLNMSMSQLIQIEIDANRNLSKTARNTGESTGKVY